MERVIPTATRKLSINQLFRRSDVDTIDRAVRGVHAVVSAATILVKYRFCKLVDSNCSTSSLILHEQDILDAVRAVLSGSRIRKVVEKKNSKDGDGKKSAPVKARRRRVDVNGPEGVADTVKSRRTTDAEKKKNRPTSEPSLEPCTGEEDPDIVEGRQQSIQLWFADYMEMCADCPEHLVDTSGLQTLSVSGIFNGHAKTYLSNVVTNIRYNFRGYVCAALGMVLRSRVATLEGVKRFEDLPTASKKAWKRKFGGAYDDVLYHRHDGDMKCDEKLRPLVERYRYRLVPILPPGRRTVDDDLGGATRPFEYLRFMIRITRFLEMTGSKKLPSPIPLKKSFIPAHYHIDTSSISQLLFDDKRLKGFTNYFRDSVKGGFPLPGLKNKANIGSSLKVQSGGRNITPSDEELYKDALWTYLADFRNRRTKIFNPLLHHKALENGTFRFDHSISTDGYSVSLLVSRRETRGFKRLWVSAARATNLVGKKIAKKTSKEFPSLTTETRDEINALLGSLPPHRDVGGDPGKRGLLTLVDGHQRVLRYTSAQRSHDTLSQRRKTRQKTLQGNKCRGGVVCDAHGSKVYSVLDVERFMATRGISANTCDPRKLKEYVTFRARCRTLMEEVYERRAFRAARFTAWSRREKSVGSFIERILEKYGEQRHVVVFYGDWGRNPNLKHQAPTPGISLRRALHRHDDITTITLRETYTSSYCPNCHGEVENARGAHALLKCCNERACGTWWDRDVLGATNILQKAEYILRTSMVHPLFGN
jgi:hypothetical protein